MRKPLERLGLLVGMAVGAATGCASRELTVVSPPIDVAGVRVAPERVHAILANATHRVGGGAPTCAFLPLGVGADPETTAGGVFNVYVTAMCVSGVDRSCTPPTSGWGGPATLVFRRHEDSLVAVAVRRPPDGARYAAHIRAHFPAPVARDVLGPRERERTARLASRLCVTGSATATADPVPAAS